MSLLSQGSTVVWSKDKITKILLAFPLKNLENFLAIHYRKIYLLGNFFHPHGLVDNEVHHHTLSSWGWSNLGTGIGAPGIQVWLLL